MDAWYKNIQRKYTFGSPYIIFNILLKWKRVWFIFIKWPHVLRTKRDACSDLNEAIGPLWFTLSSQAKLTYGVLHHAVQGPPHVVELNRKIGYLLTAITPRATSHFTVDSDSSYLPRVQSPVCSKAGVGGVWLSFKVTLSPVASPTCEMCVWERI